MEVSRKMIKHPYWIYPIINLEFRTIPSLFHKYEINADGTILRNAKTKKVLNCYLHSHNSDCEYWTTNINYGSGHKRVFIHNLVAECWLGPKPEGFQTDHINRDTYDNRYTNLRYISKSEQMLNRDYDKFQHILMANMAIKNGGVIHHIQLIDPDGNVYDFSSGKKAAKFIASITHQNIRTIEGYIYRDKKEEIGPFKVVYLNAETACSNQNW